MRKPLPAWSGMGLGEKAGPQPVAGRHHLHHRAEGDDVVRACQGRAGGKVNAVLARAADVLGVLGLNAHGLQGQANVPAHVLAPVLGGLVQKARAVKGDVRGLPLLVGAEQVEIVFRAKVHLYAPLLGVGHRVPQDFPAVLGKLLACLVLDVAVKPGHPPVGGPPGQQGDGVRVREEEQLAVPRLVKALNAGGVHRDALGKGPGQHRGQHRNNLLAAEHIAKGELDKLHVVVVDKLLYVRFRVAHTTAAFPVGFFLI